MPQEEREKSEQRRGKDRPVRAPTGNRWHIPKRRTSRGFFHKGTHYTTAVGGNMLDLGVSRGRAGLPSGVRGERGDQKERLM